MMIQSHACFTPTNCQTQRVIELRAITNGNSLSSDSVIVSRVFQLRCTCCAPRCSDICSNSRARVQCIFVTPNTPRLRAAAGAAEWGGCLCECARTIRNYPEQNHSVRSRTVCMLRMHKMQTIYAHSENLQSNASARTCATVETAEIMHADTHWPDAGLCMSTMENASSASEGANRPRRPHAVIQ